MEDCIFCKIIRGEAPHRKVYEDEYTYAFCDARPTAPIHILIVPKRHIPTLNDVPSDSNLMEHISETAREIARRLGVYQPGYRLLVNVNKEGGQVVYHLHAHFIAGTDLGSIFIHVGITAAALWRKLMNRMGRSPRLPMITDT